MVNIWLRHGNYNIYENITVMLWIARSFRSKASAIYFCNLKDIFKTIEESNNSQSGTLTGCHRNLCVLYGWPGFVAVTLHYLYSDNCQKRILLALMFRNQL